ncbi:MAG: type II toxin-antitoxin system HicA family toxin [Gammaproteobacteria bacterium]
MAKHRPLTCREVKMILKNLGFAPRPQKGTSHEQWVKDDGGKRHKVTVDCPKEPFTHDLIRWMARQAGVSREAFYAALDP